MAAVKDFFKQGSTESKIADVQKRLRDVDTELDALSLGTAPTTNLEAEEANALKRLARKEALSRVSSALGAELAELQAQYAREIEVETQRQIAKLEVEIKTAKSKVADELWRAFEAVREWEALDLQMGKFKPSYGFAGSEAEGLGNQIADRLAEMKAAKVTISGATFRREVTRV